MKPIAFFRPKSVFASRARSFTRVNFASTRPKMAFIASTGKRSTVVISARVCKLAAGINALSRLAVVSRLLTATCMLATPGLAATFYVNHENPTPVPPYSTWATAATNIQDAVDLTLPEDQVWVTNGVYVGGGRTVGTDTTTNRVVLDKLIALRSVNGPQFTIIDGQQASRCVYLAHGAVVAGFTITNGWGPSGAGVWCDSSTDMLSDCVITGNRAYDPSQGGGGVYGGTLQNCALIGNSLAFGGSGSIGISGASGTSKNDASTGGSMPYGGGGAENSTLSNCALTGNSADYGGGGAENSTLGNCILTANSADTGGGANSCTLNNCVLADNLASQNGGGAENCTLKNCTLTGNSAQNGGGADSSTMNNCINYFNTTAFNNATGGSNYDSSCVLNYCCTMPLPLGSGNIAADPRLTDLAHLSSDSPCVGAGSSNYITGTDVDGEAWANPPSIGCDEFHAGPVSGSLTVSMAADYTNVAAGFVLTVTGQISGHATISFWDFSDGTFMTDECRVSHRFAVPGDYTATLWAFNDSNPYGVGVGVVVHVVDNNPRYVSASNPNPVAPFASWATAATNIQDAVDIAGAGGTILVTNGTYGSRVMLDKRILRSINGPQFTIIDVQQAGGCASLAHGASIIGFTMTHGWTLNGAGVASDSTADVISNCIIANNSTYSDGIGGGALGGTFDNCILTDNFATDCGGARDCILNNCLLTDNYSFVGGAAAESCTLNNCTLTGNSGIWANVVGGCLLNNCIVYFNPPTYYPYDGSVLNYCCAMPLPDDGIGNITNAPAFVDVGNGDLRLQSNSPCINAGNNSYVTTTTDLDGNQRIVGGTVDIGAYEFQTPASLISYAWLRQYGLPTDGSADFIDSDHDGLNNWQEWRVGTSPIDSASVLRMLSVASATNGLTIAWQSVSGICYFLECSTNLSAHPAFSVVQSNLTGQAGTTTYTDTNLPASAQIFYRIGVQ
jgi:hypothetical protein